MSRLFTSATQDLLAVFIDCGTFDSDFVVAELHLLHDTTIDICAEIVFDVLRVRPQCLKGELAGIEEVVAGGRLEEAVLHGEFLDFFIGGQHVVVLFQQAVVEPFDKRHRQDDETVFMGLVGPVEGIGDIPDDGRFFLYVAADGGQAFFTVHIGCVADVGGWTK